MAYTKTLALIFAALAVMTASGCGSASATDKTVAGANGVLQEWIDDYKNGHYTDACALMSQEMLDSSKAEGGCGVVLLAAKSMVGEDALFEVLRGTKVKRIDGDVAYGSSDVMSDEQLLIWEDGRWRVDSDA